MSELTQTPKRKAVRSWSMLFHNNGRILDSRQGFWSTLSSSSSFVTLSVTQGTDSADCHPHCLTPSCIWRCWPWLSPHLVLLSSLPTQYSLAPTSGFSFSGMTQAVSIIRIIFPHPRTITCPSFCSGWIWANTRATESVIALSCLFDSGAFPRGTAWLSSLLLHKVKCEIATFQELLL